MTNTLTIMSTLTEVSMFGALDKHDEGACSLVDQIFQWIAEGDRQLRVHWKVFRQFNSHEFPAGAHAPERLHMWRDTLSDNAQWHLRSYGIPLVPSISPLAADALVRSYTDTPMSSNFAELLAAMNYTFDYEFVQVGSSWIVHSSSDMQIKSTGAANVDPFLQVLFYSIYKIKATPSVNRQVGHSGELSADELTPVNADDDLVLIEARASLQSQEWLPRVAPIMTKLKNMLKEHVLLEPLPDNVMPS